MESLELEIKILKKQLNKLICAKESLLDTDVLKLSQRIDKLHNEYNHLVLNDFNKAG